jgi:hypothetical protein
LADDLEHLQRRERAAHRFAHVPAAVASSDVVS